MTVDEVVAKMVRYCKLHNTDTEETYKQFREEFDDGDITLEDIVKDFPVPYAWEQAGTFDSPGYDMNSYALAWVEDGKPKLETFIVEYF